MRFGCCIPAAYAAQAAGMGYDYVEIPATDLCPDGSEQEFAATQRAIESAGIPALGVNFLVPPTMPIVGSAANRARLLAYMECVSRRASGLGGRVLVLGSGPARHIPDGFPADVATRQFCDFASLAADIASAHGLLVAVEPINRTEANFLHSLEDALGYVEAIDHPGLGVTADTYHMYMEGEPFRHLLLANKRLFHVQVCDEGRAAPGTFAMDLRAAFIFLNHMQYDGSVSIECRWGSFVEEAPASLAFVRKISGTTGLIGFAP